MKMSLNLEFDSISEMNDWLVREAALVQSTPVIDPCWNVSTIASQVEERKANLMADMVATGAIEVKEKPKPKPEKPKRKRRTKAEMAAARAAEAPVSQTDVAKGQTDVAKGNGKDTADMTEFRDLLNANPRAAMQALDDIIGKDRSFSSGTPEQQQRILTQLRGG